MAFYALLEVPEKKSKKEPAWQQPLTREIQHLQAWVLHNRRQEYKLKDCYTTFLAFPKHFAGYKALLFAEKSYFCRMKSEISAK